MKKYNLKSQINLLLTTRFLPVKKESWQNFKNKIENTYSVCKKYKKTLIFFEYIEII